MKASAIASLLLVLLGAPRELQARAIPTHELQQRFIDLDPSHHETENTRCGAAFCHALGVVVDKRVDIPVIGGAGKGAGAGAGKGGAGAGAGEGSAGRPGAGGAAGAGRGGAGGSSAGADPGNAQTGGPLGEFGTGQSNPGKRPLEGGSDTSSPGGQPDPKIPKTGAGAEGGEEVIAGDDPVNTVDRTTVVDMKAKGYSPGKQASSEDIDEYRVTAPGSTKVIDDIRIDKNKKIIFSDDLNNADDATTDRLRLWEIEMSLFVHESKQTASELKGVTYGAVSEVNTKPTMDALIAKRGEEFTLQRDNAADKEDFDALMNTLFGRSTQTLLRNTPVGKEVTSVEVVDTSGGELDADLTFFFG